MAPELSAVLAKQYLLVKKWISQHIYLVAPLMRARGKADNLPGHGLLEDTLYTVGGPEKLSTFKGVRGLRSWGRGTQLPSSESTLK